MSEEQTQNIKAKIEKLLQLATSDNENEASMAMAKAVDLMNKYSISKGQLHGKELTTKIFELKYKVIPVWVSDLVYLVTNASGVYTVFQNARNSQYKNALFFFSGTEADVENIDYILTFLIREIEKKSKKYTKTLPSYLGNMEKQAKSKAYRMGLAEGIGERMEELTNKFFKEYAEQSTSLVPVSDHKQKKLDAEEWYKKDHKVRSANSIIQRPDQESRNAGKSDSSSITINKGVNGTSVGAQTAITA